MSYNLPQKLDDGTWYIPELTLKIIGFYEQGWPSSLIGERLGLTKGTVSGRIDRLKKMGYPFKIKPARYNSRPGPRKTVLTSKKSYKPGSLPKHIPDAIRARKKLLITDLKTGECKYPVSKTSPWYFCGRPTPDGIPWCPSHYKTIYKKEYET